MLYLAWQIEPVLIGLITTFGVAYYLSVGPLRQRLAPGKPYPTKQAVLFGFGLLLLFLNEGSPLHDLAERYLLSAHMVQHLLLSYLIAPLLLFGTPTRSEEHTSELQSRPHLVCRLLLEKKKNI